MKYVRTENGIYNLEEKDENWPKRCQINDEFEEETYGGRTGRTLYIPPKAILKQADTIEDLFMKGDLLVVGNESRMPIFFENIRFLRAWLIYNGGLKIKEFYIKHGNDYHLEAKMNKKGVLELI